jgi:two-component system, cell cycle response regulator
MRILIADDDRVSRALLRATLQSWDYEVITCENGFEASQVLQSKDAPQLAILDWEMPEMDGPEVCRVVRGRGSEPYTYILLLTSRNTKADIVTGMDAGADDYLVKPFDAHELRVRLRAGTRILDLQTQVIRTREALREQATRDPLTGLLNRGAIRDVLNSEVSRAAREGTSLGVVMADLDHFKQVNDTHGHATGDSVLLEATRRMRASLRGYDAIGRYGGEEFLIVAPGCNLQCVWSLADRMRARIANEPMVTGAGPLSVTCSLGVVSTDDDPRRDIDALVRAADAALYRAKDAGRNVVERAQPGDGLEEALPARPGTKAPGSHG